MDHGGDLPMTIMPVIIRGGDKRWTTIGIGMGYMSRSKGEKANIAFRVVINS